MGYSPVPIPGFGGGLNLRDRVDAVDPTQAIDALNVTFGTRGSVQQRAGIDNLTASPLTAAGATMIPYYQTATTPSVVVGCGTRVEAVAAAGTVTSQTGLTTGTWGFARFGTPGVEAVYFGQGSTNLNKLVNTTFTTAIASTPEAGALCVMPASNRLVATRFLNTTGGPDGTAASSSPSHVYFSDEGAPETWTTTNYIQLTPGDGEAIQACVAWKEFVFVFKESKFFVFTEESADAAGAPIFNYRTVDAGVGAIGPKSVCAGTDGVYFAGRDGVYKTTGQEPQRVSGAVDPIFDSSVSASDFYQGGTLLQSQATNTALWWHNERLYVGFTSTGTANNYTLIYDPTYNWWSLTDLKAAAGCSFRRSSTPELTFCDTTNKHVYFSNSSLTSDNGTAITSRWRSGWTDFDTPTQKTVRRSEVWGTGAVFAGMSPDFEAATGTLELLNFADATTTTWNLEAWNVSTWATPAQLVGAHRKTSTRGTVFSLSFYNATLDQRWSAHRLEHQIRQPRQPGVLRTEVTAS